MTSNINNTGPKEWTPELVREYVSGAARLEMWTIPLYLCVLYSLDAEKNATIASIIQRRAEPRGRDGQAAPAVRRAEEVLRSVSRERRTHSCCAGG